jgi:hypothetical protein
MQHDKDKLYNYLLIIHQHCFEIFGDLRKLIVGIGRDVGVGDQHKHHLEYND